MKNKFIVAVVAVFLCACAGNGIFSHNEAPFKQYVMGQDAFVTGDSQIYVDTGGEKITGAVTLHECDKISEIAVVNGVMGSVKSYDLNDRLLADIKYKNNEIISLLVYEYYDGGLVKSMLSDDVLELYYENGGLKEAYQRKNDKFHGTHTEYYPSGSVRLENQYAYGLLQGLSVLYEEDGRIKEQMHFKDGLLHGRSVVYLDGVKNAEANFVDGELTGKSYMFYSDGRVQVEENFENGDLHGKLKTYYPDGKLSAEAKYSRGRHHGQSVSYYENGKKHLETVYEQGVIQSLKQYWDSGDLSFEVFFSNGKAAGGYCISRDSKKRALTEIDIQKLNSGDNLSCD